MARFWRESHDRTQCNALYTNYSVVQACWSDTPKSRSVEQSMQAMRHNFGIRHCCHIVVRHFWSDWSGFLISFTGQALVQGSRTQSGKKVPHRGTLLGIGTSKNAENIQWNHVGPQQLCSDPLHCLRIHVQSFHIRTQEKVLTSMQMILNAGMRRSLWVNCVSWLQDHSLQMCRLPAPGWKYKTEKWEHFHWNYLSNSRIKNGTLIIRPDPQNNRWQLDIVDCDEII